MKTFTKFLSLGILFITLTSSTGIDEKINAALKEGNAFKISTFFSSKVDITILDESDLLSKLEAEKLLYDFFYSNHTSDFKVLHKGKSKSGLEYTIGELITENGNFRLSYYINNSDNKETIQQIIIDAE